MNRRLYNIAVVMSLVLFVVVMGLWVDSGFRRLVVPLGKLEGNDWALVAQRNGAMAIGWTVGKPLASMKRYDVYKLDRFNMVPSDIGKTVWLGLGYEWRSFQRLFIVPHWLLALLTAILPIVWLIRRRRKRDPASVPCAKCGYDLRGSPDRTCPECGSS